MVGILFITYIFLIFQNIQNDQFKSTFKIIIVLSFLILNGSVHFAIWGSLFLLLNAFYDIIFLRISLLSILGTILVGAGCLIPTVL